MAQFDNNLRGTLSKSKNRRSEKSPEYSGSCEINGQQFWISGWIKSGHSGDFLSLAFQAKEERPPQRQEQRGNDFMGGSSGSQSRGMSDEEARQFNQGSTLPNRGYGGSKPAKSFDDFDDDIPF